MLCSLSLFWRVCALPVVCTWCLLVFIATLIGHVKPTYRSVPLVSAHNTARASVLVSYMLHHTSDVVFVPIPSKSFVNVGEVEVIKCLLLALSQELQAAIIAKQRLPSIGIITPYAAQVARSVSDLSSMCTHAVHAWSWYWCCWPHYELPVSRCA